MKKKYLFASLLALGLLGGCVSKDETKSTSADSAEKDTYKFRLNVGLNGEDANTAAFTTPWMKTMEEETDGRVKFDAFYSEELVPLGEEIRALQDGTIDIAAPILPTYNPDQFPLSDVTMLPLKKSDTLIAAKAYADLIKSDEELQNGKTFSDLEFGKHGMKVLPVQPISPYTIGAVGKHEFKTAKSLQKLSLRTGGRAHEIFVEKLGSGSVSMPWSEEFEALSRGALDGNVRSVVDYKPYGFDELITTSITGLALGHFPFVWLMPEDKFNELPEDIRSLMEDTAYDLSESTVKLELYDQALKDAEAAGIRLVDVSELDSDARELLEKASVETWGAWIEAKEKEGLPGKKAAMLWRDIIIKQGGEVYDSLMDIE
ncbi:MULTISPECIES: hypothetical protein [unclassified Sporosarcina]|uniref:hypothetical protein n=1 Tax=unclassified Sporosarcina TaxID=2647733 RepID=UPI00203E0250|nr:MULTISPECIES: hypothetical protein [unclassified Sporosarcina]GKV65225.1 hypothetical protein NCCP2331_13780 [Sporosarcina sp. NCCP-2331]GLB55349.1 hypothetical protein NCCP2378_11350 [Sporosarcina sp. NCCP-2378]